MQEYITFHSVANAIRMKRSLFVGAFLIVEGVSDKLAYGLIIDRETCSIELAHGRENAIRAIRLLNADGFLGAVAIIDSDFSNITGEEFSEDNIFRTDLHDLDCMLLNSPALDRVLEEFGSDERIAAFAKITPLIARQLAINASPIGCLRLISLQNELQLKFEGISFSSFVDGSDLKINVTEMIREVVNKSEKHHLDRAALAKCVLEAAEKPYDCWQISCGHDIIEILSIAFRKTFSGKSSGQVATDIIERCLRLAYEASYLRETQLYQAIANWEGRNPGFQVLCPP